MSLSFSNLWSAKLSRSLTLAVPVLAWLWSTWAFDQGPQQTVAFLAVWMVLWWITEPVPLFVTSLLPVLILPVGGVLTLKLVAESYVTEVFFLFLGGFLIAAAAEKWKAHEFVAVKVLQHSGVEARQVLLLFMGIAGFVTMWISNSATALLMMPMVRLYSKGESPEFHKALLLGVGYACSIGGLATLIGSPPNAMYAAFMASQGDRVSFLSWLSHGFPFAIAGIVITWILLSKIFFPGVWASSIAPKAFKTQTWSEQPLLLFGLCFLVLVVGLLVWPMMGNPISDGAWLLAVALVLFLVPTAQGTLLESRDAEAIPWDLLLLFGGGVALSTALSHVGLTKLMVEQMGSLHGVPPVLAIFALVCFFILLTEFSSNTAVAAVGIPLAAPLASVLGLDVRQVSLAVVYAASLSFMMPVATPPNAIVYSQKVFTIREMMKVGFFLNIVFAMLITAMVLLLPTGS